MSDWAVYVPASAVLAAVLAVSLKWQAAMSRRLDELAQRVARIEGRDMRGDGMTPE